MKEKIYIVGSLNSFVGRYKAKCSECGRTIYLYDDWSDKKNVKFICEECFLKHLKHDTEIVINERTKNSINKLLGTNFTAEELKEMYEIMIGKKKFVIAG